MFYISKQIVVIRMQVKHLLKINSLETIWSCSLLMIINKLLRKPVFSQKIFHLFWHCFLTLFLTYIGAIQISLCKVAGTYGKTLVSETFLNYQKGISPSNVFIISQLSRSVRLHHESFLGENLTRRVGFRQAVNEREISTNIKKPTS